MNTHALNTTPTDNVRYNYLLVVKVANRIDQRAVSFLVAYQKGYLMQYEGRALVVGRD